MWFAKAHDPSDVSFAINPSKFPSPVNENEPRPSKIQLCEQALAAARPWGLEAEVMWSALNAAAEANEHGKSFEQVLDEAMAEWNLDEEGKGQ